MYSLKWFRCRYFSVIALRYLVLLVSRVLQFSSCSLTHTHTLAAEQLNTATTHTCLQLHGKRCQSFVLLTHFRLYYFMFQLHSNQLFANGNGNEMKTQKQIHAMQNSVIVISFFHFYYKFFFIEMCLYQLHFWHFGSQNNVKVSLNL